MVIKKDVLHPENSPEDIIYPKTSVDQVEGLGDELDTLKRKTKLYLHTLRLYNISEEIYIVTNRAAPYTLLSVNEITNDFYSQNYVKIYTEFTSAINLGVVTNVEPDLTNNKVTLIGTSQFTLGGTDYGAFNDVVMEVV